MSQSRLLWMWVSMMAMFMSACAASPRMVEIRDFIGVEWTDELVHYELTFPRGGMKGPAQVRVEGPRGAIPSQVSHVERYDDGSVRSCKVWFFADVPAGGASSYRIIPGAAGPDEAGVQVKAADGAIELTTVAPKRVGIRLPGDYHEYSYPVPASQVPGPIARLLLPSGGETGAGRFDAPFYVKSYRAEVTASGPLFAEARVHYVFDVGYWTFTARVIRGCPMVVISEEMDTGYSGQEWDRADRFFSLVLSSDGFRPTQAFYTGRTDAAEYHNLVKSQSQEVLKKAATGHVFNSNGLEVNGYTLSFASARDDYYMTCWPTWSARVGVMARLVEPGKDAVGLAAVRTVEWRNPLSVRISVNTKGEVLARLPIQVYEQGWPSEGFGRRSPNATGRTLFVPETTARRHWGIMLSPAEDETQNKLDSLIRWSVKLGSHPLDEVKDWTLDWPDPMAGAQWAAQTSDAGKKALELMRGWRDIKRQTGHFSMYSMWNHRTMTHVRYAPVAAVIDSTADLTAEDRRELRRLCAYQAYVLNSLEHFPWGVGCHLGNPNMSIMAVEARIKSSLLVKDHPAFKEWGEWTREFMKDYIRRYTRESGAPYENPHYTVGVTLTGIMEANHIMMANGLGDALDTPLFKSCMNFILDWLTPPDPRFNGHRVLLPLGNASYQSVNPPELATMLVNYYKERDAQLAGHLQWWANQTLPENMKINIVRDVVPPLKSTSYKDYGVSFRHGFGTPYETLFHVMAGNCNGHYELETDQMCYTYYAKGQPINLHFGNGYFPIFNRPWLRNRVSIDHRREISERHDARTLTACFMPPAEYMRAAKDIDRLDAGASEYPPEYGSGIPDPVFPQPHEDIPLTTWHRQVLFLKDADPGGPNYFVLRDAFGGTPTKPTDLSLWFLASDMKREGNVFHYEGQCDVNMDVFVAEPAQFEPETGEFGHRQQPYGRHTGFDPKYHPDGKLGERQKFLRIKQPPGKGYMVVLYPRLKEGDPAAAFAALGENAVRIETPLATDYALVSPFGMTLKDERFEFTGTAGAVRFYRDGRIVVANCEGKAEAKVAGRTIAGEGAFVVTLDGPRVSKDTYSDGARVEVK
jgi:hypothetical protein